MTQSKTALRWASLAFIAALTVGIMYLAFSGQASLYG